MLDTYNFACSVGVEAARSVLQHYRPAEMERFAKWFLEDISPTIERLGETKEEILDEAATA